MGMPAQPGYVTAEMVRVMPDDGMRHETVYGEYQVSPTPRLLHQLVVQRLTHALGRYLESEPVGLVFGNGGDISWGPDSLVVPDIFVARPEEIRTLDWKNVRTLLLVVEVLSPSNPRWDRFTKRHLYQEVGVPLFWIIDADQQSAEVWTPGVRFPAVTVTELRWHPPGAGSQFAMPLAELLRSV
jgi:Uma2 family endonuclease